MNRDVASETKVEPGETAGSALNQVVWTVSQRRSRLSTEAAVTQLRRSTRRLR